jgi:taurine dioxygenase
MHMHTFDVEKGKGGTYFADMQHAYEVCPPEIRQYLDGEWNRNVPPPFLHGTGTYPGGIWGEHPALRTHPVTGKTSIFYTGSKTKAIHTFWDDWMMGPPDGHQQEAWFREFMEWMLTYLEDNHYGYEWAEGDLTVWDNRNVLHAFPVRGWTPEQRVFNKIEYQYEKPYYTRKEGAEAPSNQIK